MTRTDAILKAIQALLDARRAQLDAASDIRGLILDIKFSPDCLEPRTVIDILERERRTVPRKSSRM